MPSDSSAAIVSTAAGDARWLAVAWEAAERRRQGGAVAVGLFTAEDDTAARIAVRRFLRQRRRRVVEHVGPLGEAIAAWLAAALDEVAEDLLFAELASDFRDDAAIDRFRGQYSRMTAGDRDRWRSGFSQRHSNARTRRVERLLALDGGEPPPRDRASVRELATLLLEGGDPEQLPVLLLHRPRGSAAGWAESLAATLPEWLDELPALPLAVVAGRETEAGLRSLPDRRAKAWLLESPLAVDGRGAAAPPPDDELAPESEPREPGELPTSVEVQQYAPDQADAARSEAERTLFALLESDAELAGQFELNIKADFKHGPRRAEVDLACRRLRLAIEVDGYWHFQDADAYRRDRRKDRGYQRHGWHVVRLLAEDVAEDPSDCLAIVRRAYRWRAKQTTPPPKG